MTVDAVLRRYEKAGLSFGDEELDNLRLLLDVRSDTLGGDPVTWHPGDVSELLLELCPRKVQNDPALLATGPADLGRFLDHLAQTGQLRGPGLPALLSELAQAEATFAAAMQDRTRWGLAKTMVAQMVDDGVDPTDGSEQVQDWIDQHNQRAYADRNPNPLVLPAVLLAEPDALRAQASEAVLMMRVAALLSHLGPEGRPVTQTGALRLVDARALAEPCGDSARLDPTAWLHPVRRMADLGGVTETYVLAVGAGLVRVDGRARRHDPPGADPLERLEQLATTVLRSGVFLNDDDAGYVIEWAAQAVEDALPGVIALLYASGERVPLDTLSAVALQAYDVSATEHAAMFVRSYLLRPLRRLERLGLVALLDHEVPAERLSLPADLALPEPTAVRVTALGTWLLQRWFTEQGILAPIAAPTSATDPPAQLFDALAGLRADAFDAAIDAWLAAREQLDAVADLVPLLGSDNLPHRELAVALLDRLPDAERGVREALIVPAQRPYARSWLQVQGLPVAEQHRLAEDEPLLLMEAIASDPAADLGGLLAVFGTPDRQVAAVRELWRVRSPFTRHALEALTFGAGPAVGKAARKALHSLHSAGR